MQVRRVHPVLDAVLSTFYTGVLFLLYSCVLMIFWRVFMRISYTCPEHLKLSLTVESWTNLVELTGDAIDWLDQNDKIYDVWLLVAYAATSCALVQVRMVHVLRSPEYLTVVNLTVSYMGASPGPRRRSETQKVA